MATQTAITATATQNMLAFMAKNKTNKVVFGEHRTSENKSVISSSDLENTDRVYYRLDDGAEFTITRDDIKSAPGFSPDWGF